MRIIMDFVINIIEQGLIYGILAMGIYITYKILDFPDLGVDGTFPMGAAIGAALLTKGMNPYLTIPITFFCGMLAGVVTGLIHVKLKVRDLLSGIVVMTGLYSVNLFIAGTNNVPLFATETVFNNSMTKGVFGENVPSWVRILILLVIVTVLKLILDWYLGTKSGFLLRAVGDNDTLVTSLAKDKGNVKILGLAISNGLVALSGSIFAQQSRVFDISMGTGTLVVGLASVIMGASIFGKIPFLKSTTAVILGSISYKACVAIALRLAGNIKVGDNAMFGTQATKLITSLLFLVILVAGMERRKKVKIDA